MKYTVKLLDIGKPDRMGRVYTKECADVIVKEFENAHRNQIPCTFGTEESISSLLDIAQPDKWCGIIKNPHMVGGDKLYAEFETIETVFGKTIDDSFGADISFSIVPRGLAYIDKNGIVSDFELLSFGFVPNEE